MMTYPVSICSNPTNDVSLIERRYNPTTKRMTSARATRKARVPKKRFTGLRAMRLTSPKLPLLYGLAAFVTLSRKAAGPACSPAALKVPQQVAHGLPAVADGRLLVGLHLGERASPGDPR